MKVLLDENVDYDFKFLIQDHDVRHIDDLGWKGLTNGLLLRAAEEALFAVIVTTDRNFRFQQNIAGCKLALAVLEVHPKNLATLSACVPELRERLPLMEPGQAYLINPNK